MRIEEYTAQELFELLNELDETDLLEAKSLHEDSTRSIMESVCAFSNEPGMGGGVILLGAREAKMLIATHRCMWQRAWIAAHWRR